MALLDAASAAHIEAQVAVWAGMIHVWHMFHAMLPQGTEAMAQLAAFVVDKWTQAETH
jgi:acetyl esterase/lipase